MAFSSVEFSYSGGPQVFETNFALGTLRPDYLRVTVDGEVDGFGDPILFAFTYNTSTGDVTVTDTLPNPCTGMIRRVTPIDLLVADFEQGDDTTRRNINRAVKQCLMAVQEAADGREDDSELIQQTVQDINVIAEGIGDSVATTLQNAEEAQVSRDEALSFRNQASASAATASSAASTATAASSTAVEARDVTVAARDTTLGARDTAVAAADDAVNAAAAAEDDAEIAANAATSAANDASTASTAAGVATGARDDAVDARDTAVAAAATLTPATQEEAEAGTNNTAVMTPLRTRQAIDNASELWDEFVIPITAAVSEVTVTGLGIYKEVMVLVDRVTMSASTNRFVRVGNSGGIITSNVYYTTGVLSSEDRIRVNTNSSGLARSGSVIIREFNTGRVKDLINNNNAGGGEAICTIDGSVGPLDRITVFGGSGNLTGGTVIVRARR